MVPEQNTCQRKKPISKYATLKSVLNPDGWNCAVHKCGRVWEVLLQTCNYWEMFLSEALLLGKKSQNGVIRKLFKLAFGFCDCFGSKF
jgi:hypothetical protein